MAKYKGKDLSLTFGAVEFKTEGTQVVLQNEESDTDAVTFAEVGSGSAVGWFFELAATSDYGVGSFWDMLWTSAGQDMAYLFKPYGNAVASPSQPHFSGKCTTKAKPPVGGTAGEIFTFEARLDCTGEPVKVTI